MRTRKWSGTLGQVLLLGLVMLLQACGGGGGSGTGTGSAGGGGGVETSTDIGARMSTASVRVERDLQERASAQPLVVSLLVDKLPAGGYWYRASNTSNAILYLGYTDRSTDAGIDFQVGLAAAGALGVGTYDDRLTVEVCLDSACARPARGSPFVVSVTLVVGHFAPAEVGVAPFVAASRTTLSHDLIDAAYSPALDAVITVSRLPTPALNVFYLASGQTRSVPLATVPTAVGLAPDGLQAAVGHDGAVSVVALQPPASAMTVRRFAVSLPVGEVVINDSGRVFAFGNQRFSGNAMHLLDVADGTETVLSPQAVYGVAHATWHPSGERFYFANENVSPTDIFRVDAAVPSSIVDSPHHGEYNMCSGVWVSDDGARLFTACGNTFVSSANAAQDMRYAGALPLSGAAGTYAAVALSTRHDADQVVLLAQPRNACDPRLDQLISCFTHVNVYTASTLALQSSLSLPPISVGSDRFAQTGRYVFHRANGGMVLLSELRDAPDPAAGVRLSQWP